MKHKHFTQIVEALKQADVDVSEETRDAFQRLSTYVIDDPNAPPGYWDTALKELRAAVVKDYAQKPKSVRIGALLKCVTDPHALAITFPAVN